MPSAGIRVLWKWTPLPRKGKTLLKCEPVFREKCHEIADLFLQYKPTSLLELIENDSADFSDPEIAQSLLFMLQVALVTLLKFWGIEPNVMLGFSVGEVAAAHCAGVISLEDAVKVIHFRSSLQAKVVGGKMVVVGNIPVEEISDVLVSFSRRVCIAGFSSPCSCILSGDADAITRCQEELAQRFEKRNIFLCPVSTPAAYHSYMMDPILEDIEESIGNLVRREPKVELISTVTGEAASEEDFTTGKYWSRNVREPTNLAQAITTAAKGRENAIFVEITPKRAFQKNIRENLGEETIAFSSLQPNKEYETLFDLVKSLFEFGHNLNWPCFYRGLKTTPTDYPRYQFDHKNLKTYLKSLQLQNKIAYSYHPLIDSANDGLNFTCFITQDRAPYVFEHKANATPFVPGSCFVELGLACVMGSLRPRVPLSTCQVRVEFLAPCVISQNFLNIKVKLEAEETKTKFEITSSSSGVYARGEVTKIKKTVSEKQHISLGSIFQRCKLILTSDEVYEKLLHHGFQYGAIFKRLNIISFCDELKEGITTIKVTEDLRREMYEYHIHPVLLDCFLQMGLVMATRDKKIGGKTGFPSKIGKLTVLKTFEVEMNIYVKVIKYTEDYFEVCGFFIDKYGSILARLEEIGFTYSKQRQSNDNFLLENIWKQISLIQMLGNSGEVPPCLVLMDTFGIAQQLKKYLPCDSKYIGFQEWEASQDSEMRVGDMMKTEIKNFHHVLFMWRIKKLNEEIPGILLQYLTKCCEAFRQLIVALKDQNVDCSVTVITYRTTRNVDHINPGFVLSGMTRASLIEVPNIMFRMIDISDTSPQNIASLADAIIKCEGKDYPELCIDQGRIFISEIRQTSFERIYESQPHKSHQNSEMFTLCTSDPYNVVEVTAMIGRYKLTPFSDQSVEVEMDKICIHSEDYFPVSTSSCSFGNTLYWAGDTMEKHKLVALDFSGTVTAIGKDVKEVMVGDHIATCFPLVASSKVSLPETICFHSKKFPVFRNVPCASYFIIA
ncbi:probable polyketide synthase 1 [Trichechus manatus latirostris]|uniref:Probable polyketide synthase 1 n=1 Tax=Trichechus manatus latirostris TaxID=127582 RepID=A0A2Y9RRR7_TRIMA|nr:probable polyketide synthase 1 [Trichechus manatus latirostris]